jgi:REP element-mobilizing transposase RayT
LFETKKRFGLDILNYTVTSNHIHLLVADGEDEVIPKSIQLVAGKTAQQYNRRKKRKGAFWEDRYHATAIETGEYFLRCLVYIDLNMVRNGVVAHPSAWQHSGYNEIQYPPQRYGLLNREKLIASCGLGSDAQLRKSHKEWVEEVISGNDNTRQPEWSESIAVGSERFVRDIQEKLLIRTKGRKVVKGVEVFQLRDTQAAYNAHFIDKNGPLSIENGVTWEK